MEEDILTKELKYVFENNIEYDENEAKRLNEKIRSHLRGS